MRILICEDSALLREGLVRLLEDAGHEIAAALPDALDLGRIVDETAPELCILDVRLPPSFTDEGIRAALALRDAHPQLPVLVLSQYVEERYASELIAGRGGALGYLLKDRVADVAEFVETVARIGGGATVFDPEVVSQLLMRRTRDERMERLTERERTVLALIAEGKSNQAIARAPVRQRGERREAHHIALPEARARAGRVRQPTGARRTRPPRTRRRRRPDEPRRRRADRILTMSTTITPPPLPPAASAPPVTAPTPPRRQGPRTIAILTIAFGGLIIAGTVISAVLTTVGSAVARSETLSVDTSGITDLDIDVSGGELSVVFADIDEATLQVDGGWRATGWTLERNEEELVVRSPDGWFGWGWFGGVDRAVLTLPQPLQSERLDASLSLSAGSLDIDGTFGDLDLDLSAGEMVVAGTAQQLSVDVSAGGATLELEGVREAEVDVSAGGVRGSLSGAAPADLAITVSAGSVDLTLADEAYNVISDVSAGTLDNRLETSTSATRQVRVEISAGDVTLRPER